MRDFAFKRRSVSRGCHSSTCSAGRGFSLVELTLVVVVIGIMAAVAVPRYSGFIAKQQVQAAARRLLTDLALLQRRAKTTSASQTMTFLPPLDTYAIAGMNHPDRPGQPYTVDLSKEPYSARFSFVVLGNDTEIIFDGYGIPDSDGTIIVTVGQYSMLVYVDANDGKATAIESDADGGFDLTPLPINKLPGGGPI